MATEEAREWARARQEERARLDWEREQMILEALPFDVYEAMEEILDEWRDWREIVNVEESGDDAGPV